MMHPITSKNKNYGWLIQSQASVKKSSAISSAKNKIHKLDIKYRNVSFQLVT